MVVAAAAVAVYDVVRLRQLRRSTPSVPVSLDHTALVGEGLGTPVDLVVLGDSAAAGYGNADARDAFPYQLGSQLARRTGARVRIASYAVSGARTRDLTSSQVPELAHHRPDVVVLGVGVNDAIGRRGTRVLAADTRELLAAVRAAAPSALVALVGCPDLSSAPGCPWPVGHLVGWVGRRVSRIQERVADPAGVAFVAFPHRPVAEMFGPDGFHPGPAGQAAAARAVVDVLVAAAHQEGRTWISD